MPNKLLKRLREIAPESGPIVVNDAGKRYHPDSISHLYAEELKTLPEGVPRITLKNLRHSSLTLAYDESGDLLAVSRRAGHSSTTITARYYVRPQSDRDREVADMMDKKLSEPTDYDDCFELETTF